MTTYERKQLAEQEKRLLIDRAVQLRQDKSWASIAKELRVPKSTVESMVRDSGALKCGCGEMMARPSESGTCGFCEQGLAA